MKCAFVTEGQPCDADAKLSYDFFICDEHRPMYYISRKEPLRSVAAGAMRYHSFEDYPGHCYMVLVPDGTVKIGFSNTEELLRNRLARLKKELGPIVTLLELPGGFVTEAYLHDLFADDRLTTGVERFRYSEEMAEFISEHQGK